MKKGQFSKLMRHMLMLALAVCIVLSAAVYEGPVSAQAAEKKSASTSEYKNIFENVKEGKVVKSGKYYFKYKNLGISNIYGWEYAVYISKNRNSGFRKISTCKTDVFYSNGVNAYYINSHYKNIKKYNYTGRGELYKYTFSKLKATKITDKIKLKGENANITNIYGDWILIGGGYVSIGSHARVYNQKTRKLYDLDSNAKLISGNYMIVSNRKSSDIQAFTRKLCKLTEKELKVIKNLGYGYYVSADSVANGKLYYTSSPDSYSSRFTMYEINLDGSGKKVLGKSLSRLDRQEVIPYYVTSKCCVYGGRITIKGKTENRYYKYTYSTKKTVRLTEKQVKKYRGY